MKRKRKQRALIVIGVAAFAVVFGGSYSALKNYVGKVKDDVICDNIYINDLNLSGMTKKEAQKALENQKTTDESKTVTLTVRDEKVEAFPVRKMKNSLWMRPSAMVRKAISGCAIDR